MPVNLFRTVLDNPDGYFIATYDLSSTSNLRDASWDLAIGQSVGNPKVRNAWETDELFERSSCKILHDEKELQSKSSGLVKIAFPICNTDWEHDGISQILVQVMGGQLDIDRIVKCRLVDLDFPTSVQKYFKGPKFGLQGVRKFTGVPEDKPLFGAIIKPKVGITPEVLLEMTKQLVEGGVNFIKEDEIMSNPWICPLEVRVPLISAYLKEMREKHNRNVVYCFCINADQPYLLERVKRVHELGGNGVHVNFWCGLGAYKAIRDLDLPIFVHFQKSGDKILTDMNHRFAIDWHVVCKLVVMSGVDFGHVGMIGGGYSTSDDEELKKALDEFAKYGAVPALSCGVHPGLVGRVKRLMGHSNFMFNCGGAVNGHPSGSKAGAMAMRQAIDGNLDGKEYLEAVQQWGLME